MRIFLFVNHWTVLVTLICSRCFFNLIQVCFYLLLNIILDLKCIYCSCIIFTLATAELINLEGRILQSNNSSITVVNETLPEEIVSPPIVPPLVDVIHGKVRFIFILIYL